MIIMFFTIIKWIVRFLLFNVIVFSVNVYHRVEGSSRDRKCELIKEPKCTLMYNSTAMPNLMGITSQSAARKIYAEFHSLQISECSLLLDIFLCNYFFPSCSNRQIIKPCREFCSHIQNRCSVTMNFYLERKWSDYFECGKLPKYKTENCYKPIINENSNPNDMTSSTADNSKELCLPYQINIEHPPNITCYERCNTDIKYRNSDKYFAKHWSIIWSLICLLSSLFTIFLFSVNSDRFRYPEKPIIFLSICYFFYSCGFLLGIMLKREDLTCLPLNKHHSYVISKGNEPFWCKINFLFVYFFGTASSLWWVMLTVTWFLSATKNWSYEAIESMSSLLHLFSWGIPALESIIILILKKVDADELTGQCFIGNNDRNSLLLFVLLPQVIYLSVGIVFLAVGYYSLIKVRKTFMHRPNSGDGGMDAYNLKRMEKFMAKIAVFSVLYVLPISCVIGSYIADLVRMGDFNKYIRTVYQNEKFKRCITVNGLLWSDNSCTNLLFSYLPPVELKMLRIFMQLVIGITSGVWIWGNSKTIKTCQGLFNRIRQSCRQDRNKKVTEHNKKSVSTVSKQSNNTRNSSNNNNNNNNNNNIDLNQVESSKYNLLDQCQKV